MVQSKKCCECKTTKPVSEFHKNKRKHDGLASQCKSCVSAYSKKRYKEDKEFADRKKSLSLANHKDNRDDRLASMKTYRDANKDSISASFSAWREANKERKAKIDREWKRKNRERANENNRRWLSENPDKAREIARKQRAKNPGRYAEYCRRRQAAKMNRTPLWADRQSIESFYQEAAALTAETGIQYSVDHVIPLQGELVSGLHVPENLQVITLSENSSKSNRWVTNES